MSCLTPSSFVPRAKATSDRFRFLAFKSSGSVVAHARRATETQRWPAWGLDWASAARSRTGTSKGKVIAAPGETIWNRIWLLVRLAGALGGSLEGLERANAGFPFEFNESL